MNPPPDWQKFVRVSNPSLGQDTTLCAPALSITFFLRLIDYDAVKQLYDAVMKLMQPELTHYRARPMKRPAKIKKEAFTMIPTWMGRPGRGQSYWWTAYAGADLGVEPPGIYFLVTAEPITDA